MTSDSCIHHSHVDSYNVETCQLCGMKRQGLGWNELDDLLIRNYPIVKTRNNLNWGDEIEQLDNDIKIV